MTVIAMDALSCSSFPFEVAVDLANVILDFRDLSQPCGAGSQGRKVKDGTVVMFSVSGGASDRMTHGDKNEKEAELEERARFLRNQKNVHVVKNVTARTKA